MEKETLRLEHIKQDLNIVAKANISNKSDWHYTPAVATLAGAIVIAIYTNKTWMGLLIALFGVPGLVRYMIELKYYRNKTKELYTSLDRGDISISVLELSHIATETIYEPYTHGRGKHSHRHRTKQVRFFYFVSGGSWRVPQVSTHYQWSNKYNLSTQGLENISISGKNFYFIHLQGDYNISYIYPCNYFKLDNGLKIIE